MIVSVHREAYHNLGPRAQRCGGRRMSTRQSRTMAQPPSSGRTEGAGHAAWRDRYLLPPGLHPPRRRRGAGRSPGGLPHVWLADAGTVLEVRGSAHRSVLVVLYPLRRPAQTDPPPLRARRTTPRPLWQSRLRLGCRDPAGVRSTVALPPVRHLAGCPLREVWGPHRGHAPALLPGVRSPAQTPAPPGLGTQRRKSTRAVTPTP